MRNELQLDVVAAMASSRCHVASMASMSRRCPCHTGALPDAADVDMTDKFAPPSGKEDEMMLTCECGECGYTLFIAAGREGKFFGDSYKCPECGAPKSKFTIDEAPSA